MFGLLITYGQVLTHGFDTNKTHVTVVTQTKHISTMNVINWVIYYMLIHIII